MLLFDKPQSAPSTAPEYPTISPDAVPATDIAYYDSVPAFIAPELDRLYQHINCSFSHFRFRSRAENASTYVARRGGRIVAIFVHRRERHTVSVLNEMVALETRDIEEFARYVFGRFGTVTRISFSLMGKEVNALPFPCRRHGGSEDIVISLPPTSEAYFAGLSSKTRQNIKHRLKTLSRDHPRLEFKSWRDGDIDPRQVGALVELKRKHFHEKGRKCGLDVDEAAWLAEQAQAGGLLTMALLDGRVCGGSLSLRIGEAYFATLAAYDTGFAKHGLGMLCCYLTICETIAHGVRQIHLGWGRNEYKFKLLGVRHDMAELDVYRSRLACLRQADRVLGQVARDRLQRAKLYLLEHESDPGLLARFTRTIVRVARTIERARAHPEP